MHFPNSRGHGWKQEWCSGENNRLPPKCPGFKSRRRRHMWVEFVLGSLPCSQRFFPGYSGPPSTQKPTFPNSNSTRNQADEEPLYLVDVLPINRLGFETSKDSNLLRCICGVVRKKIPGVRL